jgi:hypothetical protein
MSQKINKILEDRQQIHGDAEENFARAGRGWGALLGIGDIPAWQVALMMDFFKSVRCVSNPLHEDNWLDKLGYTKHGMEISDES